METVKEPVKMILLTALTLVIGSCEKNPVDDDGLKVIRDVYSGAVIVNEGHFQQGDAGISYFDSDAQRIYNGVFADINGEPLGDVGNSILLQDTLAYIVVNNSDKIEVVSTRTFKRARKIDLPAGTSPRYVVFSGEKEIMTTSLYGGKVLIINSETGALTGEITVGENPEELVRVNGSVFVANSGFGSGNTVSEIDLSSGSVQKNIAVGDNPRFMRLDPAGALHVLCSGAYNDWSAPDDDTPGGIWVIDPLSGSVKDSLTMPAGSHPGKFDIGPDGTGYVIVGSRIWMYDTRTLELVDQDLVADTPMTPYALRFNGHDNILYILDAADYINPGKLWLLNVTDRIMHGPFTTGAIPGDIAFLLKQASE